MPSTRVCAVTPVSRALLAALLLLTSCAAPAPVVTASPSASASPSPSPSSSAPPYGGVLRVVQGTDITTLDPLAATDPPTLAVLRQVFETLVDLAPGTTTIVPKLADRWEISGDGLTYTFVLRAGVRFHDGTPLDATAVAASFAPARMATRPDLGSRIRSVVARDALTVVLTLGVPYAPLLASLASPAFGIVSPACLAQGPSWSTPASRCAAGTGPFRLEAGAWEPGDHVDLTRAPAYWAEDASGHRLPYLDGVRFRASSDDEARAALLRAGTADVVLDPGVAGTALATADPDLAVARRPSYDASFIGISGASGPLGSSDVRRAVAMAIDRAAIARSVYGAGAKAASQLVPPGIIGYDDTLLEYVRYDVAAAKKLLADAGQGAGFTVDLWYPAAASATLAEPRRVAEAIAADLAKVGITATPRPADVSRFANDLFVGQRLWIAARVAAWPDADELLADVTQDPVVQALLERARTTSDVPKRAELYKQVTKLLQQRTARIPLFNTNLPLAASRRVHGLVAQPIVGESFATVWLGR